MIKDFIQKNSKLTISIDKYEHSPGQAIYIGGNIEGFYSLLNIMIYRNIESEPFFFSDLSFIENNLEKELKVEFILDVESKNELFNENGCFDSSGVLVDEESEYIWLLSETEAMVVTNLIHGLKYGWDHLHFCGKNSVLPLYLYLE